MERRKQATRDPFTVALEMLARRPYSVAELRRALERKFGATPSVAESVARLRELGYLDDKKFAEHYASSLARNRGLGRHRIRRELKAKLIDYRYIDSAIEQALKEIDEHKLLERALAKKLQSLRLPLTPRKLQSLCASLLRRGFPVDAIMKSVRSRPELKPVAEDVVLEPEEL